MNEPDQNKNVALYGYLFGSSYNYYIMIYSIFGVPLFISATLESYHMLNSSFYPLASGQVVERNEIKRFGRSSLARLTIQIEDNPETVEAILAFHAANEIPNEVTFHFSGNPDEEVFLTEEENPLIGVIILPSLLFLLLGIRRIGKSLLLKDQQSIRKKTP